MQLQCVEIKDHHPNLAVLLYLNFNHWAGTTLSVMYTHGEFFFFEQTWIELNLVNILKFS